MTGGGGPKAVKLRIVRDVGSPLGGPRDQAFGALYIFI
jgi:hypothetical protein